jgi:hypothetical protein
VASEAALELVVSFVVVLLEVLPAVDDALLPIGSKRADPGLLPLDLQQSHLQTIVMSKDYVAH